MDFIPGNLDWLKDNMMECKVKSNITEITTPFLDQHNDFIQIYIVELGEGLYKVTDAGYTVCDLQLTGIDEQFLLAEGQSLQKILNKYSVNFEASTDELYVDCDGSHLPAVQHQLLQCILHLIAVF